MNPSAYCDKHFFNIEQCLIKHPPNVTETTKLLDELRQLGPTESTPHSPYHHNFWIDLNQNETCDWIIILCKYLIDLTGEKTKTKIQQVYEQ